MVAISYTKSNEASLITFNGSKVEPINVIIDASLDFKYDNLQIKN